MDEISNKTLATLLVVAIVISLAGTFFAMRGVSQVTNIISGAASTGQGTAKVNITETNSIFLKENTVDFGEGQLYTNSTTCTLKSGEGAGNQNASCWNSTGSFNTKDFQIENDGNTNMKIELNSTTSNQFFATSSGGTAKPGEGSYEWEGQQGGDSREAGCDATTGALVGKTPFNAAFQTVCSNMTSVDAKDRFNVSIVLNIPQSASGGFTHLVDFRGTKV